MLLVTGYSSKKELKARIGEPLSFIETSMFGTEYKPNGVLTVAHRPSLGHWPHGREFFAQVTMAHGRIDKVS